MKIQIEDMKGKSAYAYCRVLVAEGYPVEEKLEIYRGDMLCITVGSIGWGASHVLREYSKRGFVTEKYRLFKGVKDE